MCVRACARAFAWVGGYAGLCVRVWVCKYVDLRLGMCVFVCTVGGGAGEWVRGFVCVHGWVGTWVWMLACEWVGAYAGLWLCLRVHGWPGTWNQEKNV